KYSALPTLQIPRKARDAFGEPILADGEAPADKAFAFRAEGAAWREPEPGFAHQALAEGEAVALAFDAEEGIHRSCRQRGLDAGHAVELTRELIARLAKARQRMRHRGFAVLDGHHARALHEYRRARSVVFD